MLHGTGTGVEVKATEYGGTLNTYGAGTNAIVEEAARSSSAAIGKH